MLMDDWTPCDIQMVRMTMMIENIDEDVDEWGFTSNSRKSCSRKPHNCHHVTTVGSRSNRMTTKMIQDSDDSEGGNKIEEDEDWQW